MIVRGCQQCIGKSKAVSPMKFGISLCILTAALAVAASADQCETALKSFCAADIGLPASCDQCALSHKSALRKAGCTQAEAISLCKGGPSPGPSPAPGAFTKILLGDGAGGGKCLDGSPAGYYYGSATNATDHWVIYLEGGGACYTETECKQRAKGQLGSSTHWAASPKLGKPLLNSYAAINPDFFDAHRVYVPYCTGDVHGGQRNATSPDTWGLWFDGHLNVKRIIADLTEKSGMGNATQILLTGSSAGGIGTFVNADWLTSQFPEATVKAAPQAGWFFPGDPDAKPTGIGLPFNFHDKEGTPAGPQGTNVTTLLWQPYGNAACEADYVAKGMLAWFCGSVGNTYKVHVQQCVRRSACAVVTRVCVCVCDRRSPRSAWRVNKADTALLSTRPLVIYPRHVLSPCALAVCLRYLLSSPALPACPPRLPSPSTRSACSCHICRHNMCLHFASTSRRRSSSSRTSTTRTSSTPRRGCRRNLPARRSRSRRTTISSTTHQY